MRPSIPTAALFVLFLLAQCGNKPGVVPEPKHSSLGKGSVIPIDTINVHYNGQVLLPGDWQGEKVLYFDFFTPEIVISDLKGNILSQFNVGLMGLNDIGTRIYGARFMDESSIAVVTDKGYYLSDLNGVVKERYPHPFDLSSGVYMNGDFHLGYDRKHNSFVSLLRTSSLSRIDRPDFYKELRHLTVFNLDSKEYTYRIPYEKGSYYLNDKYFNNEFGAHFAINGDSVSVVYPLDPKIYTYSLDDYRLLTSFDTQPDSFRHIVKFPFGGGQVETRERLTGYANSVNYRIFSAGDTVVHSYSSGLPLTFFDGIDDLEQYNNASYKYLKYYLQVFINGKKAISDFELPRAFPMICLYSNGKILLLEQERWMPHSDGVKKFLLCRLSIEPASEID